MSGKMVKMILPRLATCVSCNLGVAILTGPTENRVSKGGVGES